METELWIILAIFGVSIVGTLVTLYIRKYAKDHGVDSKDLEAGVEVAKDTAINELKKKGTSASPPLSNPAADTERSRSGDQKM